MEIELIFRLAFAGAAIFIGLILGVTLLTSKKANRNVNLLLLVIIVFFIGQTLDSFLIFSGLFKETPHFVLAVYPFGFLIGAVYYFYIRIVLNSSFKFRWYDTVHLILMFRMYYSMKWFYPQPTSEKIKTLNYLWFENPNEPSIIEFLMWSEDEFLTVFYLIATIKLINLAINSLKAKSSNTDIEYLSWLRKATYIFAGLTILEIIRAFIVVEYDLDPGKTEIISSIILLGFITYLVLQMIHNPKRTFYTLSTEADITSKDKFNVSVRMNLFLKNIISLFIKRKSINYNLLKFIIAIILIGCVYFYFFELSLLQKSGWYYFVIVVILFFILFQFTIIDHHIMYQTSRTVNSEFADSESNELENSNSKPSNIDSNFLLSLKEFMKRELPHLNANLKCHELANQLDIEPHYLSKMINQELGQNFYTFINRYRVEEFKKRVVQKEYKNYTLTGIAEEVGFNSKSSFNRIFKAMSGITPSEFVKNQKKRINFQ